MFGLVLYSLDRLYRAVERHANATGEWPRSVDKHFPQDNLLEVKKLSILLYLLSSSVDIFRKSERAGKTNGNEGDWNLDMGRKTFLQETLSYNGGCTPPHPSSFLFD